MQDSAAVQDYHHSSADFNGSVGIPSGGVGGISMSPGSDNSVHSQQQPVSPVSDPVSPVSPISPPGAMSPRGVIDILPPRAPLLDSFGKSVGRIQGTVLFTSCSTENLSLFLHLTSIVFERVSKLQWYKILGRYE